MYTRKNWRPSPSSAEHRSGADRLQRSLLRRSRFRRRLTAGVRRLQLGRSHDERSTTSQPPPSCLGLSYLSILFTVSGMDAPVVCSDLQRCDQAQLCSGGVLCLSYERRLVFLIVHRYHRPDRRYCSVLASTTSCGPLLVSACPQLAADCVSDDADQLDGSARRLGSIRCVARMGAPCRRDPVHTRSRQERCSVLKQPNNAWSRRTTRECESCHRGAWLSMFSHSLGFRI